MSASASTNGRGDSPGPTSCDNTNCNSSFESLSLSIRTAVSSWGRCGIRKSPPWSPVFPWGACSAIFIYPSLAEGLPLEKPRLVHQEVSVRSSVRSLRRETRFKVEVVSAVDSRGCGWVAFGVLGGEGENGEHFVYQHVTGCGHGSCQSWQTQEHLLYMHA